MHEVGERPSWKQATALHQKKTPGRTRAGGLFSSGQTGLDASSDRIEVQDVARVAEHQAVAAVRRLDVADLLVLDRTGRLLDVRAVLDQLFDRLALDEANELRGGSGR